MLCRKPYMAGNVPFGCGQCLPCRINRRRQWMWRQFFESLCHEDNCFVTLTYEDQFVPQGGNLSKPDVQLWLKKLRWKLSELQRGTKNPVRVRYFLVGEYGPQTLRPHYHASLFGLGVAHSALIQEAWGKGFTSSAEFNSTTAQYVAGYVVKKLTDMKDPRLLNLSPEFALMSRRPGIGSLAMSTIAKQLSSSAHATTLISETGDVPHQLLMGSRKINLGRYLLKKLRQEIGLTDEAVEDYKKSATLSRSLEMLDLLQTALLDDKASTTQAAFLRSIEQKLRNVEARSKLRNRRTL